MLFISGNREDGQKMDGAHYKAILKENLLDASEDLKLGQWFTFQQNSQYMTWTAMK